MGTQMFTTRSTVIGDRKKTTAFCFSPSCVKEWLSKNHERYIEQYAIASIYRVIRKKLVYERRAARLKYNPVGIWTEEKEKALQEALVCYNKANDIVVHLETLGDPALNGIPKHDVKNGIECPQCGWALRWVPKLQEDKNVQSDFRGIGGFSTVELSPGIREQYSELIRNEERDTDRRFEEEVY